jgi:hypothetical protein
MILQKGEIDTLIDSLKLAIELTEMNQRSLLPPGAADDDPADRANRANWKQSLTVFKRLLRKLEKIEAS